VLATPEMPQGFASRSAAPCHGERRRRTGHSTWARPTGFAVDSLLEGAGFELSVPGERGDGFEPSSVTSGPFLLGRRCSGPSCS